MGTAEKQKKYTPEEYFALDESSGFHYEYHDGDVFDRAVDSVAHGIISGNMITALNNALGNRDCFVTTSDVKLEIAGSYFHPDIMVVCGEPEYSAKRDDTLRNPKLIVEVLSDSTEGYDRGEKFKKYRSVESFTEYVLVSQKKAMVDLFFKNENKEWVLGGSFDLEAKVKLQSLGLEISMQDIYRRVKFEDGE